MDALWNRFVTELTAAGYTLDDLSICNHDLFISIAEELRVFSQTEVDSLVREWERRFAGGAGDAAGRAATGARGKVDDSSSRPPAKAPAAAFAMSAATLFDRASHLLRRVAGEADTVGVTIRRDDVEMAAHTDEDSAAVLARGGSGDVQTLWKLCSPATVAKLRRGGTLSAADDADDACTSGLVFYRDSAMRLGNATDSMDTAAQTGWSLAAFAVATGVPRSVASREAHNLSHYRTAQCQAMMRDAGYDSLRLEDADGFVTFTPSAVLWLGAVALRRVPAARLSPTAPATAAAPSTPKPRAQTAHSPNLSRVGGGGGSVGQKTQPLGTISSPSWIKASVVEEGVVPSTRCSLHPQKEVEFWSPGEKRLLCSHCLYYDGYSRDTCIPIEQATQLELPALEKWIQNVATFSKEIAGVMDAFENAEADVQRQQQRAMEVIRQEFARLRSKLDSMEAELVAQCEASAKDSWQQLHSSAQDVEHTVQQVQRVVLDAAEPIQRVRDGFTDATVCIRLLRCVQRAFAAWAPVAVPPYMVVESVKDGVFLQSVSTAFDVVPPPTLVAGQVELPEAVDVNFLKNGCTEE